MEWKERALKRIEALREGAQANWRAYEASQGQKGLVAALLNDCFAGMGMQQAKIARHLVLKRIFGKESTKELTSAEASALLSWLIDPSPDAPRYSLKDEAKEEARYILMLADEESGQRRLL